MLLMVTWVPSLQYSVFGFGQSGVPPLLHPNPFTILALLLPLHLHYNNYLRLGRWNWHWSITFVLESFLLWVLKFITFLGLQVLKFAIVKGALINVFPSWQRHLPDDVMLKLLLWCICFPSYLLILFLGHVLYIWIKNCCLPSTSFSGLSLQ